MLIEFFLDERELVELHFYGRTEIVPYHWPTDERTLV